MIRPHTQNGKRPPDDDDDDYDEDEVGLLFTKALRGIARGDLDPLTEYLRAVDRALAECPLYPELIIGSCGPPNSACPLCYPTHQC
jgi:hypothetical protein